MLWAILAGVVAVLVLRRFLQPKRRVVSGNAVVITGASAGMGKDMALALNGLGFTVFAGVRKEEDGKALAAAAANKDAFFPIRLDVTSDEDVAKAAKFVDQKLSELKTNGGSGLCALVNNAGIALGANESTVEGMPISVYQQHFDVNLFGVIRVTQAFLPLLRKFRSLEGLTDSMRRELMLRTDLRVVLIEPGYVGTDIQARGVESLEKFEPHWLKSERYPEQRKFFVNLLVMAEQMNAPARVISDVVRDCILSTNPPDRVLCGGGAAFLKFIPWLPRKWFDAMIKLQIKNIPENIEVPKQFYRSPTSAKSS